MRLHRWNEIMCKKLLALPNIIDVIHVLAISIFKLGLTINMCLFSALYLSAFVKASDNVNISSKHILSLDRAIIFANRHDIWLDKSDAIERGLTDKSVASSALPDPILSASILNLPTDGFEFNQEPMTQMKVSIAQLFPRGDTLELQKQRHLELAKEQPLLRADRRAKTELTVTRLWLSAFQAQASTALIEDNRILFEQLIDIASASYSSLLGKGRQQDIIRAEVELSRLNDRLIKLKARSDASASQLLEWLVDDEESSPFILEYFHLPETLPLVNDLESEVSHVLETKNIGLLAELVGSHPLVKAKDKQIEASQSKVNISKQQYKAQWGVNASYAYRDDDPLGNSRADFFSVGVSLKLPLFSNKRQDGEVSFAIRESEVKRTEKQLMIRELAAGLSTAYVNYTSLLARKTLYQNAIIPQLSQQSEAVVKAYTNDDGDFAEVTQTRIAELDAKLELLGININLRKNVALIQYYITHKLNNKESPYEH